MSDESKNIVDQIMRFHRLSLKLYCENERLN